MKQHLFAKFEKIAQKHLYVKTLKVQNVDRLDFYDCGVVGIQKALQEAYELGKKTKYKY